jgi:hypothetical protein
MSASVRQCHSVGWTLRRLSAADRTPYRKVGSSASGARHIDPDVSVGIEVSKAHAARRQEFLELVASLILRQEYRCEREFFDLGHADTAHRTGVA